MTSRRFLTVAMVVLAISLAAVLAGCSRGSVEPINPPTTSAPKPSTSTSSTVPAGHFTVIITDSKFAPPSATVRIGTRVIWENKGTTAHNVTFNDGSVKSPDIKPNDVASHTFGKAGTFVYHDSKNPQLTGTIIVK